MVRNGRCTRRIEGVTPGTGVCALLRANARAPLCRASVTLEMVTYVEIRGNRGAQGNHEPDGWSLREQRHRRDPAPRTVVSASVRPGATNSDALCRSHGRSRGAAMGAAHGTPRETLFTTTVVAATRAETRRTTLNPVPLAAWLAWTSPGRARRARWAWFRRLVHRTAHAQVGARPWVLLLGLLLLLMRNPVAGARLAPGLERVG